MKNTHFNPKYFSDRIHSYCIPEELCLKDLEVIVTIPSYKEEHTRSAIESLLNTNLDPEQYLILVLFNYSESDSPEIKEKARLQIETIDLDRVYSSVQELPHKSAGVGLARKILMDSASKIFFDLGKPEGVILAYDADCFADPLHMDAVLAAFKKNHKAEAASIYFEHDLASCIPELRQYIVEYELHLRVYINWKKYIGLPFAFQTIGSSMAVRSGVYSLVGGMNKRKAGEDFYFLHKFSNRGAYLEIKETCVYPSSRVSDRVPFGTGRAIMEASESQAPILTYNPKSYLNFKEVIVDNLETIYKGDLIKTTLDPVMTAFFKFSELDKLITECKNNTSRYEQFVKRFYNRCDAFFFMKYLHFMRDSGFSDHTPLEAGNSLLTLLGRGSVDSTIECLEVFRLMDKT